MLTFFESLILGHFVGDYILQNNWMALNKTKSWVPCFVHVALYTLAICLFTWTFNLWWILVVFTSHWFIDRYSLADKYLQLTKGRSLTGFIKDMEVKGIQCDIDGKNRKDFSFDRNAISYDCLSGGFTSLVYVVVDNTFHILLMVGGMALLKFLGVM